MPLGREQKRLPVGKVVSRRWGNDLRLGCRRGGVVVLLRGSRLRFHGGGRNQSYRNEEKHDPGKAGLCRVEHGSFDAAKSPSAHIFSSEWQHTNAGRLRGA